MTLGSLGKASLAVVAAALVGGCANSGFDLSTSSIAPQAAAKPDPICASLTSQINALKSDGTIEKLEQASEGKTSKVSIKRTALQKQAELNKAYAQFQTRCGPAPTTQAAAQAPAATQAPATTPN
ncbi:hypothetical protein [Hyphomicrobium sp.]|uniref:hypothetical protein n=1 Tax=Hyphomicrobium sp. TaxID=82 RepID=UPI000FBE0604|nr:hypothetical protein [Hyphomicrobium sp.]RUO99024.1 MAG: hypothetical protein EKK30_09230 [Hyphomicrobium sp.]